MMSNQAEFPIETMARSMGVSRSGFYAWQSREPSARDVADRELTELIRQIHVVSRESYGAPRIHAELADSGVHVGRKRVERLMKAAGLAGVSRRRSTRTTIRDERVRPSADLVDRNFYADGPNMLWVADITYVPTWAGFLYLAIVLDAFSRRIVGWAMGTNLKAQLVLDAMNMAIHCPAGHCAALSRKGPAQAVGCDPSQRPGLAIHLRRLRPQVQASRGPAIHGIGRRCL